MDDRICKNTIRGQHLVVRCKGCGYRCSTKNIGDYNEETKEVTPARSVFDIYGETCTCTDPREFPLIHDHNDDKD